MIGSVVSIWKSYSVNRENAKIKKEKEKNNHFFETLLLILVFEYGLSFSPLPPPFAGELKWLYFSNQLQ